MRYQPILPMSNFNQLCVLHGITDPLPELGRVISSEFGVRVKMEDSYYTLPDGETGAGGRRDVLFYIHDDDISKFAVARFGIGVRWWEDVLKNHRYHGTIGQLPSWVVDKYPETW